MIPSKLLILSFHEVQSINEANVLHAVRIYSAVLKSRTLSAKVSRELGNFSYWKLDYCESVGAARTPDKEEKDINALITEELVFLSSLVSEQCL